LLRNIILIVVTFRPDIHSSLAIFSENNHWTFVMWYEHTFFMVFSNFLRVGEKA